MIRQILQRREPPIATIKREIKPDVPQRSYQAREAEYMIAKERIFGPSKKILRARDRYEKRKDLPFRLLASMKVAILEYIQT